MIHTKVKVVVLMCVLVIFCSVISASGEGGLKIYCWQGFGTGSNLSDKKFAPRFKNVLNPDKNTVTVEVFPAYDRILQMMQSSNILYASTHSGVPKKGNEQALQVGKKDAGRYLLAASEIAAQNCKKPALIIINGCCTFPLLEETPGKCRNIATAFGISKTTRGRTYMGFQGVHSGAKGDDFFRVFFYFWCGAGGKNLTVSEASDKAEQYIREAVAKQGGDAAQKYYLSTGAANCRKDLVIFGDPDLRYADIAP